MSGDWDNYPNYPNNYEMLFQDWDNQMLITQFSDPFAGMVLVKLWLSSVAKWHPSDNVEVGVPKLHFSLSPVVEPSI